jgi:hypothetical protein
VESSTQFTDPTLAGHYNYTITRTWTAKDVSGNHSSKSQLIHVIDTTPPAISPCPATIVLTPPLGSPTAIATWTTPTATDNCSTPTVSCFANNQTVSSGAAFPVGTTLITCIASDPAGNTANCSFNVTVLQPLRIVFQPPLTAPPVANTFKPNQTIPHKITLINDATGQDVTASLASLVTVRLDVEEYIGSTSATWQDVPETYTGVGGPGGLMVYADGQFQYNLKTSGYESGTVNNQRYFQSTVTVSYNSNPTILIGRNSVTLESK